MHRFRQKILENVNFDKITFVFSKNHAFFVSKALFVLPKLACPEATSVAAINGSQLETSELESSKNPKLTEKKEQHHSILKSEVILSDQIPFSKSCDLLFGET